MTRSAATSAPAGGGLLAGVRVLDLSNVLAGPYCAYQLALLGADVVKVETPGTGDLARVLGAEPTLGAALMGASYLAQNANKRSITLNLKTVAGVELLKRLVATADVLVENFRPGVMKRLGVDHEVLRAVNPGLVYCAISGFGQEGPMRAAPAYDQIVQGLSGLMSVTGTPDTAPLRVGYPVADTFGGVTAAFAVSAALARKARTGEGAVLDVSMLDATIASMGWVVSNYLIAGQAPEPMGNDNFTAAPSGSFRTSDGLINIAANKQEQFLALCEAIGRPELAQDPRFARREERKRNRAALGEALEDVLTTRGSLEWEQGLNALGVPAARVLTVPQALELEQVRGRGLIGSARVGGRDVALAQAGYLVDGVRPAVVSPPPELGEQTEAILQELGLTAGEIEDLRAGNVL